MDSWADLGDVTEVFLFDLEWPRRHDFLLNRSLISFLGTRMRIQNVTDQIPTIPEAFRVNPTKALEYDLLDFFCSHYGRLEKFWLPVWPQYFELVQDIAPIGTNTIVIRNIHFNETYQGYERLYIKFRIRLEKSGIKIISRLS